MKLTEKQCEDNSHISTEEIQGDIDITQKEIDQYQAELDVLLLNRRSNRLGIMKRESGISERKVFIDHLQQILEYRKSK